MSRQTLFRILVAFGFLALFGLLLFAATGIPI